MLEPPDVSKAWVDVSISRDYACGITVDGELYCWGRALEGQRDVPHGYTWRSVSCGEVNVCGVTTAGEGLCWGYPYFGVEHVPAIDGEWAFITVARGPACGIIARSRQVVCWGSMEFHQPPPQVQAASVSLGVSYVCILTLQGAAMCWGQSSDGRQVAPQDVPSWRSLSAGSKHACGVSSTGTVRCWGGDDNGKARPPAINEAWYSVTAGFVSSCGITVSGTVHCWGLQLTTLDRVPAEPAWHSFHTSYLHTCGVTGDRRLVCWGGNNDGVATVPAVAAAQQWEKISAGDSHNCALSINGSLFCWGLGLSYETSPPEGYTWIDICVGQQFSCGLTADRKVQCWGKVLFSPITKRTEDQWVKVACGELHVCALSRNGELQCGGRDFDSLLMPPTNVSAWHDVSCAERHICGIATNDEVVCWGYWAPYFPGHPSGLPIRSISTGRSRTCALDTADTVYCWTDNGQPAELPPLVTGYQAIHVGETHACGLLHNQTLLCWSGVHPMPQADASPFDIRFAHFSRLSISSLGVCGYQYPSQQQRCMGLSGEFFFRQPSASETCLLMDTGAVIADSLAPRRLHLQLASNQAVSTPELPSAVGAIAVAPKGSVCLGLNLGTPNAVGCFLTQGGFDLNGIVPHYPTYPDRNKQIVTSDMGAVCLVSTGNALWCSGSFGQFPSMFRLVSSVAMGNTHFCAILESQAMACWSPSSLPQGLPSEPTAETFLSLSVSDAMACGITTAFAVQCYGSPSLTQLMHSHTPGTGWLEVAVSHGVACASHVSGRLLCPVRPPTAVKAPGASPDIMVRKGAVGLAALTSAPSTCSTTDSCLVSAPAALPFHEIGVVLSPTTLSMPWEAPFVYLGAHPSIAGLEGSIALQCHTGTAPCLRVTSHEGNATVARLNVTGDSSVLLSIQDVDDVAVLFTQWTLPMRCIEAGAVAVAVGTAEALTVSNSSWQSSAAPAECATPQGHEAGGALIIQDIRDVSMGFSTWMDLAFGPVGSPVYIRLLTKPLQRFSLFNASFERNSGNYGGGVAVVDVSGEAGLNAEYTMRGVSFVQNIAVNGSGGAIHWKKPWQAAKRSRASPAPLASAGYCRCPSACLSAMLPPSPVAPCSWME